MAHLVDLVFRMQLVLCHLLAQLRYKSELFAFDLIRLGASNGAEELDGMYTIPKSMLAVPAARAAMGCSERSAEKVLECWTKDSLNRIDKART